jgi:hypothetical protein
VCVCVSVNGVNKCIEMKCCGKTRGCDVLDGSSPLLVFLMTGTVFTWQEG